MRRLLALLLVPACLMCAGCDETNPNTVTPETTTSSKSNTETIVKCDDLPNSKLSECEIQLHDGRHLTSSRG